jgi:diguanylate cyclase (GGDEF)-like protein
VNEGRGSFSSIKLNSKTLRAVIAFSLAFLLLHMISVTAADFSDSPQSFVNVSLSYLFSFLPPFFAVLISFRLARRGADALQLNWALVCAGVSCWCVGVVLSGWADAIEHTSGEVAAGSDFFFFIYGVPILLAVSLPAPQQRTAFYLVIDGIQAAIAGLLAYIQILGLTPFVTAADPVPASLLVHAYNLENLALAIAATLRLLSCQKESEERTFFATLTGFLWCYAIFTGLYNAIELGELNQVGPHDLLPDLPFLLLAGAMYCLAPKKSYLTQALVNPSSLALFIENGSPLFFTLALLALGTSLARSHFGLGMAAVSAALILYATRATAAQGRYMRSEIALGNAKERLEQLTLEDPLTKISNRRGFDQAFETEWNSALASGQRITVMLVDVDFFKQFNDRFGHQRGDQSLASIALALQRSLRSRDLVARYGGEEFVAILPGTDEPGARRVAERMQELVREIELSDESGGRASITISIGVCVARPDRSSSRFDILEASDRALYRAKQNGRDRIEVTFWPEVLAGAV